MHSFPHIKQKWIRIALLATLIVFATIWLFETPHGVDGKLGAVGFAVCHQIESHTLAIGGKLLPLCARCIGMYLGALTAFAFLANGKKNSASPSRAKIVVLAVLFLVFVVDGVNSSLATFFKVDPLYDPSNFMRLFTGLIMGMILANLILPMWNQTLWKQSEQQPVLATWKQFTLLVLCEIVVGVMVWLDIPLLYYPVAILSTGTVLLILTMVYSLLWSIILNKENTLEQFKDGWTFYLLGALCAFAQIGLMDLLRVSLVGSWSGFQL